MYNIIIYTNCNYFTKHKINVYLIYNGRPLCNNHIPHNYNVTCSLIYR